MKKKQLEEMLELIYPLENNIKAAATFRKKRRKKLLALGIALFLAFVLLKYVSDGNQLLSGGNRIPRPERGGTSVTLQASDGNRIAEIAVRVNARRLAGEELEMAAQDAMQLLAERIKGKNASLLAVTGDLNLVDSVPEYDMDVVWDTSASPCIRLDGTVWNRDLAEPEETILRARLLYGGESFEKEFEVRVLPYFYTEAELFENEVMELVAKMAEETAEEEYLQLPGEFSKGKIKWEEAKGTGPVLPIAVGTLLLILVYAKETANLRQKLKERERQLLKDYSEFLSKFLLLLGSGMNVRSAWERMIANYRKTGKKRLVYDEMIRAMAQIEVGMPEQRAYEQFGRRCGLLPYLRFVTILNQNLKKGSKDIVRLLQMEANEAFSERKEQARRRGEEAGTKLLLPMGGMLVIVLIIILVPAFASFR